MHDAYLGFGGGAGLPTFENGKEVGFEVLKDDMRRNTLQDDPNIALPLQGWLALSCAHTHIYTCTRMHTSTHTYTYKLKGKDKLATASSPDF